MKVIAVIPCYNEAENINDVVEKVGKYVDLVIVADDGSLNGTIDIARQVGAYVCGGSGHEKGTGVNTKRGISSALYLNADIIVTLDGDGQHNPDETLDVIQPILDGRADFVIGSRFINDYKMPRYRKFGIDVITWLCNVLSDRKVVDSQSGFRAFTRKVAEDCPLKDAGFGFSTEMIINTRALGYKITEVPISCIYHEEYSRNSTLNPIRHGLGVAWATIKWRVRVELLRKRGS